MDFIKSILPTEWFMQMFSPDEDNSNRLYLHVRKNGIFPITRQVSRVDVIEFLKYIHASKLISENETEVNEIRESIKRLFEVNSKTVEELMGVIPDVFGKETIVFMSESELKLDHSQNDAGLWITKIIKETGTKEIELAVICTQPTYY